MKSTTIVRVIDLLPTIFGSIAIAGLATTLSRPYERAPGEPYMLIGALLTIITALVSIATIGRRQTYSGSRVVIIVNGLWFLITLGFFAWLLYLLNRSFNFQG